MSRYLLTHDGCACRCQAAWLAETPHGVALFLWGKDVMQHTVYEGECPYYFMLGDVAVIQTTLMLYPLRLVEHLLPLDIPVKALWRRVVLWGCADGEALVCRIGGARPCAAAG